MKVRGFEVRKRHWALGAVVLLILLTPLAIVLPAAFHTNSRTQCQPGSAQSPTGAKPPPVTTKTVLEPSADSKTLTWSFDGDRKPTYWDVVLTATPPLPSDDPRQLEITPSRIVRSDHHEAFRKALTFTTPLIRAGGKKISFKLCADPEKVSAGTYTGSIDIDGAGNVTGTSLALSVTARSSFWFGIGLWVVFGVVIFGLTLKSIADYQRALRGTKGKTFNWWRAVTYIWRGEDLRIVATLIGIGTALLSYAVLFNGDHIWGQDAWKSILAAAQGAFAAVGAQGVLDGFRGGGQQQAPETDSTTSAQVTSDP